MKESSCTKKGWGWSIQEESSIEGERPFCSRRVVGGGRARSRDTTPSFVICNVKRRPFGRGVGTRKQRNCRLSSGNLGFLPFSLPFNPCVLFPADRVEEGIRRRGWCEE